MDDREIPEERPFGPVVVASIIVIVRAGTSVINGGVMALSRRVSFWTGLRYRGKQGMLNWILHRITGLGIVFFVGTHVVVGFFGQQFGDDISFALNSVYEAWEFQLFIYFSVLFHALNGARIALMDVFPSLLRYQRELLWLQWIVFLPIYGLPSFIMIQTALAGG
jgi:succinate dehydrogenase / fumarate reductase cytochrome b subunit